VPRAFASAIVPVTTLVAGQRVFYQADGLGSVTELTDGTGAVVRRYSYDAFGALLASPGAVAQPYTFTGRELDGETELYNYRERMYDAGNGRFVQEDPMGLAGGMNLYVYAANNPIVNTDPFGLQPTPEQLGLPPVTGVPAGIPGSPARPSVPNLAPLIDQANVALLRRLRLVLQQEMDAKVAEFERTLECGKRVGISICFNGRAPLGTVTVTALGDGAAIKSPETKCFPGLAVGKNCCKIPNPFTRNVK
jgi:RHS repeat-associated protein